MKKYIAELIGTAVLVLMGCGSAVIAGPGTLGLLSIGFLGVSIAFGLSVMTMVYAIGPISGCHINPAITFAMWIAKKISGKDALMYILFQIIGAFIGVGILAFLVGKMDGLAVNAADPYSLGYTIPQCVIAECVMTFLFLLVIFGATSEKAPAGFAGIAIGLSLTLIHLVTIPITNTSVNPARSLAPAVLDAISGVEGAGVGLSQIWIFILAPLVGAGLAALVWKAFERPCCCSCKKEAEEVNE
ncbi:MAG: MIP family channel protein [Bacteroidales bacterium]|jgi:aquaporin Z|nr:MIP family channel protein [Bacteroidales bacterium]